MTSRASTATGSRSSMCLTRDRGAGRVRVDHFIRIIQMLTSGETGFVTASMISKLFTRQEGQSVKAFVCGPPPQVKSIAGPKDGPRQGELLGALKELGYSSDEVFKF